MSDSPNLQFFIHGKPAPGGSKNVFPMWDGKGNLLTKPISGGRKMPILRVVDAGGEGNKKWREDCARQARTWMAGAPPFDCALKVEFIFFLQRPLAHHVAGKRDKPLRPDAPIYHTSMPDALKFGRSTEDALTGIVWVDDSQTVRVCSEKRYCGPTDKPGCAVRVILLRSAPQGQLL